MDGLDFKKPKTPQDNKRQRKFVIALIIVVLFAIAWFTFLGDFLLGLRPQPDDPNLFPFEDPTIIIDGEGNPIIPPDGGTTDPVDQRPTSRYYRERLRKITDFAVTNFDTIDTEEQLISQRTLAEYREAEEAGVRPEEFITDEYIPIPLVEYNSRENGLIYDSAVGNDITRTIRSTTVLPGAGEVFFDIAKRIVWMRYFSQSTLNIETFAGTLSEPEVIFTCSYDFTQPIQEDSTPGYIRETKQLLNIARNSNLIEDTEYSEALVQALEDMRTQLLLDQEGEVGRVVLPTLREFCERLADEKENQDPGSIAGQLITPNIVHVAKAPEGDRFFILYETDDTIGGYITDQSGTNHQRVFQSAFTDWLPQWVTPERIVLQTKASDGIDGFLFDLNPITRKVIKLIGPIPGLTTNTSPDGNHVLLSRSLDSGFGKSLALQVFHFEDRTVNDFEIKTLPEKCVWAGDMNYVYCAIPRNLPDVDYPDAWYQDRVTFTDDFWKLDTEKGTAELLFNPSQARSDGVLDVTMPQLSESEDFIFFINKKDGVLWSLEIDGL